jgi:hypothetical protein
MYFQAVHDCYPEITVDEEGDIYWNALKNIHGLGYGSSYLSGTAMDLRTLAIIANTDHGTGMDIMF